jgi:tripartite-type tricarboxylate transporter receptor subunit TctC
MLRTKIALTVVAATAALAFTVTAQAWEPEKPIKIVVGFSPGGGTDLVARNLVASSQEFFPVPLVVVNKPGAGGTLAADFVAKSKADGYTVLVAGGSESTSVPNHREVSYSLDDFRGVLRCIRSRIYLVSHKDSGITSIADLKAKAMAAPGKLSYGSSGQGTLYHSTMLLSAKSLGVDMRHVPYKGGAPMMAALLGGHIDITLAGPEEAAAQYQAGAINMLALASQTRLDTFKDVPTMKELGFDVYIENQKGIVAPKGTPDEVVQYLHDNFKKGLDGKVWGSLAKKLLMETAYLNGDDFMGAMKTMSANINSAVKSLSK